MNREFAASVAGAKRSAVGGTFYRHCNASVRSLDGSTAGGRWGVPGLIQVLYLGRPEASVIVEAYRHLVDPFVEDGMRPDLVQARNLIVASVNVTNVLDLRDDEAREAVGLTEQDLTSEVGDYAPCQRIARVANQLELHGVLAPAATGLGETLALFERHLPAAELPTVTEIVEWTSLPDDPRRLRIVEQQEA